MKEEKISDLIKALNTLLRENISLKVLHDETEKFLQEVDMMELTIEVTEPTRLFAFFEWNGVIISAHLYRRINHLLIKNLIEAYNMRKRNSIPRC